MLNLFKSKMSVQKTIEAIHNEFDTAVKRRTEWYSPETVSHNH
jgi:hypothetical protein